MLPNITVAWPITITMTNDVPGRFVSKPRDDKFYLTLTTFEVRLLIFIITSLADMYGYKVEGVLFRVPRDPFEAGSDVFKGMFALPPTDALEDGVSDKKPLVLHGISSRDFRALLKVLFHK